MVKKVEKRDYQKENLRQESKKPTYWDAHLAVIFVML